MSAPARVNPHKSRIYETRRIAESAEAGAIIATGCHHADQKHTPHEPPDRVQRQCARVCPSGSGGAVLECAGDGVGGLRIATESALIEGAFEGRAVATPQRILYPTLVVTSIVIDVPETSVELVVGSGQIPATLTLSASDVYEPNQGIVIDGTPHYNIGTGELTSFSLSGELDVLGETIPISASLEDYPEGPSLLRIGSRCCEDPIWSAPTAEMLVLTGLDGSSNFYLTPETPFSADLGSAGGVSFVLDAAYPRVRTMTFVPEPTSALLQAAALLTLLGLRRRLH